MKFGNQLLAHSVLVLLAVAGAGLTGHAGTIRQSGTIRPDVIYGEDNRKDLYQVQNPLYLDLADSTVALISVSSIQPVPDADGKSRLNFDKFGPKKRLCREEPFWEQPAGAFCSGTLVGEDLILTAGHCITDEDDCASTRFIFGYSYTDPEYPILDISPNEIYSCASIIDRKQEGADWAVIRLDRKVPNHRVVEPSTAPVTVGQPITVIGYPSGLPAKVADGAAVRSLAEGYFIANLDTYGGNSGSGVFSSVNGDLVGILVRGESDFRYNSAKGCTESNRCADNGCRGEDSTFVAPLVDLILKSRQ